MADLFGPAAFGAARTTTVRPVVTPTPGGSDSWIKDCTSPTARDGTELRAGWANAQLANLRALVRGAGVAEDNSDDMLLRADRAQRSNFAAAAAVGGTANAIALTFNPAFALAGDLVGVPLRFQVEAVPTAAVTVQVDGIAAAPLRFGDGAQVGVGELLAGQLIEIMFDGASFRLLAGGGVRWGMISGNLPSQQDLWAALQQASNSYPTVNGASGLINLAVGVGALQVSDGNQVSNRFSTMLSTDIPLAQRQFTTVANKTYHLRFIWPGTSSLAPIATYPNGRYLLLDVTDPAYNPGALSEANTFFDTTPNNALLAKITSNGSNVLTVLALLNTFQLTVNPTRTGASQHASQQANVVSTLNWSRRATIVNWRMARTDVSGSAVGPYLTQATISDRYSVSTGVHAFDAGLTPGSQYIFGGFDVEYFA